MYFGATMTQGLLVLNDPTYVFKRWHGTLLMLAFLVVVVFVNTVAARVMPKIEGFIFAIHVCGFFAILIPLTYFAPHSSAKFVFTFFNNASGFSSNGLVWFISLLNCNLPFIGYDGPCHMCTLLPSCSLTIRLIPSQPRKSKTPPRSCPGA